MSRLVKVIPGVFAYIPVSGSPLKLECYLRLVFGGVVVDWFSLEGRRN